MGALTVDGKLIANNTLGLFAPNDATCDDTTFPHDLTGKRAMGLSKGPGSADTVDKCRQACCDAGASCELYQFSEHPSSKPDCWLGKSASFVDDPKHIYQSRSRVVPSPTPPAPSGKPYHLKVMLSRYIFASIDNFKIQKGDSTAART